MPTAEKNVMDLFADLAVGASETDANQGRGSLGQWPTEGDHDMLLEDLRITPTTFRFKNPQGQQSEVPGVSVQAIYTNLGPTEKDTYEVKGRPAVIPRVPLTQLPEVKGCQQQTRARIASERVMGFFATILGSKPSDWQAGAQRSVEAIEKAKKAGSGLIVKTNFTYRDGKALDPTTGKPQRIPNEEFMVESVSS